MQSHALTPSGGQRGVLPFRRLAGDERLATLIAGGDDMAFRQLYDRYHQPLYRYCRSLVHHDADAQDALQSTFTAAFTALRHSRRNAPMRPWLFRIAHNEAISLLRRRRPEQDLDSIPELGTTSLEHHVEERERLTLLVSDLRELPEQQRGALVMRELSGLSHEEIAVALEVSPNAAKQTIFAARRSLNELAEGRAMSCDEICRLVSDADGRVLRSRRVRAHLQQCHACETFAAAIPARRSQLRALAPALPGAAAAGLFARVAAGGSGQGVHGAGVVATGAAKAFGTAALVKSSVVAVAVVATATAGLSVALKHPGSHRRAAGARATQTHPSAAGAGPSAGTRPVGGSRAASAPAAAGARSVPGTVVAAAHGHGKRAAVAQVVRAGVAGATNTAAASLATLHSGHGSPGGRSGSAHSQGATTGSRGGIPAGSSHRPPTANPGGHGSHVTGAHSTGHGRPTTTSPTSSATSTASVHRGHPSTPSTKPRHLGNSTR